MVYPGLLVGGGHSDPLFSELLNDELIGVDDAEYGQMRTTTSEEERWATTLFEDTLELRVVLKEVQKRKETTNIFLNKKLSKEIRCLSRRITSPFAERALILEAKERSNALIERFVHHAIRSTCPSRYHLPYIRAQ